MILKRKLQSLITKKTRSSQCQRGGGDTETLVHSLLVGEQTRPATSESSMEVRQKSPTTATT